MTTATNLTAREADTLALVCNGHTNEEIAYRQGVSVETIKTRVKVIRRRYGARNRSHLVALAFRAGDAE